MSRIIVAIRYIIQKRSVGKLKPAHHNIDELNYACNECS